MPPDDDEYDAEELPRLQRLASETEFEFQCRKAIAAAAYVPRAPKTKPRPPRKPSWE